MIKHVMLISIIVEPFKVITAEKRFFFNFYQITNNQLSTFATFQPLKMATILINNLFRGLIIYCAEREILLFRNSKSELYKFKSSINFMRKNTKTGNYLTGWWNWREKSTCTFIAWYTSIINHWFHIPGKHCSIQISTHRPKKWSVLQMSKC